MEGRRSVKAKNGIIASYMIKQSFDVKKGNSERVNMSPRKQVRPPRRTWTERKEKQEKGLTDGNIQQERPRMVGRSEVVKYIEGSPSEPCVKKGIYPL